MQLFVIACFTRLKVLRLDLCLLFSGRRELSPRHKNPVLLVSVGRLQQSCYYFTFKAVFAIYSSSDAVTEIAGLGQTGLLSHFNDGIYS